MGYKLLIVEDENVIRRGLVCSVDWHAMDCIEILEAADGEEAVCAIREKHPDIVVMDINIPIKNGLQVLEDTREFVYSAIILSGYADFAYAQHAMKVGAIRYLLKPVDFDELREAVKIAKEALSHDRAYNEVLKARAELINIPVLVDDREMRKKSVATELVLRYIREHFNTKITLYMIAEELHYSETFLIRQFKRDMNMGFNEYLSRYRIREAIEILRCGNKGMEEIATDCGFKSSQYFYKVFVKYIGCSPSEYIRLLKEQRIK